MDIANVVKELVKNAVDAQSSIVRIELNENFDLRVIDDGCGFDEKILQNVGERQLFISNNASDKLRYGKSGKFLLTLSQVVEGIHIESIKRDFNLPRFYKSISFHKSEANIYRASRDQEDAQIVTAQGSSVVIDHFILQDISDPVTLESDIVNSVIEMALINYDIKFSIKDTARQTMLYETDRMNTLFAKFEHFLESHEVFSKLHFVSSQKHNVLVDLFICENGISTKSFQFVFLNKSIEPDGKWMKFINDLCKKEFKNDLIVKFPVYLADIRIATYLDEELENNLIIGKCIKKCVDKLTNPISKSPTTGATLKKKNSHDILESLNEGKHQENCNDHEMLGVHLGDWIFNNSYENYHMAEQNEKMYRNKVCENWVISLGKPKPKDPNDSLNFVDLEKVQPKHDDEFKIPLRRTIRKTNLLKNNLTNTVIASPLNHVRKPYRPETMNAAASKHFVKPHRPETVKAASTNHVLKPYRSETVKEVASNYTLEPFKPSQRIEELNISTLKRARELLKKHEKDFESKFHHNVHASDVSFNPPGNNQNCRDIDVPTSQFLDFLPHNLIETPTLDSSIMIHNNGVKPKEHFQIYRTVKETFDFDFDFEFHNNMYKSNVNMNFSSAIVSSALNNTILMNDPLFGFFDNDSKSTSQNYQSSNTPQSVNQPNQYASATHATSEVHYHRQQLNNSSSTSHRSEISSRITKTKTHESKSIRSRSNARTTVARRNNTSTAMNDGTYQNGQPVTININFGESK